MKKILLSFAFIALIGTVAMIAPGDAMAEPGFANTFGDGGSTFVKPERGDIQEAVTVDNYQLLLLAVPALEFAPVSVAMSSEAAVTLTPLSADGGDATASGGEPLTTPI